MNDTKIKISACLVVYNDGKLLSRCLDSIKGVVDEIIIFHDGPCYDQAESIAKEYGAQFVVAPRVGVAEPIRPLSYALASGEWILQIDADEYLSEDLKLALPKLVNNSEIDAYEFIWPIYNGKKYLTKNWPYKRCLFRRDKMSFLGLPNYIVEVSGNVRRLALVLEHKPDYNNYSFEIFKKKWLAWAYLQAEFYLKDFKDIKKWQYSGEAWPKIIQYRRRWPLLMAPFDALVIFFKTLFPKGFSKGLIAYKTALMFASFRLALDFYIYKQKNNLLYSEQCLCGGNNYKTHHYFKDQSLFYVLECRSCGLGRTWPEPIEDTVAQDFYNDYDDYKERLANLDLRISFTKDPLDILKKHCLKDSLLDVGCNLGVFVKQALAHGYQAEGIDLSQSSIDAGIKYLNLENRLHCGRIEDLIGLNKKFKIISYLHCLEHINDPKKELNNINRLIEPGGYLLIEVPNFKSLWRLILRGRWYGFSHTQHIWQFSKKSLIKFLENNDFSIVTAKTNSNLYHKINFSPVGLLKGLISLISTLTQTSDKLIVLAKKNNL